MNFCMTQNKKKSINRPLHPGILVQVPSLLHSMLPVVSVGVYPGRHSTVNVRPGKASLIGLISAAFSIV